MKKIRIGAGLGFYGDSWQPLRATIARGEVQYIASDHLAELTLSILQKDRAKDPNLGYTRDLLPMMKQLWPLAMQANDGRGIKFLVNAGGLNPVAAGAALQALFRKQGWSAKIAVVTGDDVLPELLQCADAQFCHLDSGQALLGAQDALGPIQARLEFANAYLGAAPLVQALQQGADIVITGRVADAALFLAPLAYEFGWDLSAQGQSDQMNLDRLAQGLAVGHLLECSGQGSGGNFGGLDWQEIPDLAHIGYPIAEVQADGSAIISKAPGTGGRISFDTLRQQLLYEVHDPANYFAPDLILDMSHIQLEEIAPDVVRLSGARGKARPEKLKVVAGYAAGWMGQASIGYCWPQAWQKANYSAQWIKNALQEMRMPYQDILFEYLGHDSILGPLSDPALRDQLNEVYLRVAVRCADKAVAEGLPRLFPSLGLSGPPFIAGRFGMQAATQLLGIWPTLVAREVLEAQISVQLIGAE